LPAGGVSAAPRRVHRPPGGIEKNERSRLSRVAFIGSANRCGPEIASSSPARGRSCLPWPFLNRFRRQYRGNRSRRRFERIFEAGRLTEEACPPLERIVFESQPLPAARALHGCREQIFAAISAL
jgi:hypothetical protein